jgi:hypothetical protein
MTLAQLIKGGSRHTTSVSAAYFMTTDNAQPRQMAPIKHWVDALTDRHGLAILRSQAPLIGLSKVGNRSW